MSTLCLTKFRLKWIDHTKVLLTALILFQIIDFRLEMLELGSGRFAMFKKQLLVRFECDNEVVSVALSFAETLSWRQGGNVMRLLRTTLRLERMSSGVSGVMRVARVLRVGMMTAAVHGRLGGSVLLVLVLVGVVVDAALTFVHLVVGYPSI